MRRKLVVSVLALLPLSISAAYAETSTIAEATVSEAAVEIPAVATEQAAGTIKEDVLHLRAQLKARQSTLISSEMGGRINALKLRDGERFSNNQTLVEFNCTVEDAQLNKAKATLEKKNKTYEVNQRLAELKSISTLEVSVAKTEADEAKADVSVAQAVMQRCSIHAPFSGKVVELMARAYQSVRPGDPLMEIIDDKNLEVEFMAPSNATPHLKPGKRFRVTLDEIGKTYNAEIIRIGGKVDAVSQTIKVYGRITDKSAELLPGMSGAIDLAALK
ncbi:efflux RND transporter periplasmic adaptor subunit [Crenothrix sp.]|uniref:efflux RND transporter periplasmic adaptor subunit n=1 Tax=Crenothrix sp. TaxID=3100433 RepID=UPI00374D9989